MAATQIECPHCGRVGSTPKDIIAGSKLRCPGCSERFEYQSDPVKIPVIPEWSPEEFSSNQFVASKKQRLSIPNKIAIVLAVLTTIAAVGWIVLPHKLPHKKMVEQVVATSKQPLTTDVIAEKCGPSVAIITDGNRTGSGFVVAPGLVVTNTHVIDAMEPTQIFVRFPDASELDRGPILGQVEYYDLEHDLSVLRVATRIEPIPTATNHQFRRGQDVVIIGNPTIGNDRIETVVSRAVIGSKIGNDSNLLYQISGSINPGNSGGPVIDLFGDVIGVATLKAKNQEGIAFCVPAGELVKAIERTKNQNGSKAIQAAENQANHIGSSDTKCMVEVATKSDEGTTLAILDFGFVVGKNSETATSYRSLLREVQKDYPGMGNYIFKRLLDITVDLAKSDRKTRAYNIMNGSLKYYEYSRDSASFDGYLDSYQKARQTMNHDQAIEAILRP